MEPVSWLTRVVRSSTRRAIFHKESLPAHVIYHSPRPRAALPSFFMYIAFIGVCVCVCYFFLLAIFVSCNDYLMGDACFAFYFF